MNHSQNTYAPMAFPAPWFHQLSHRVSTAIVFVLLSTSACRKKSEAVVIPAASIIKIQSDNSVTEIQYDAAGRISNINTKDNDGAFMGNFLFIYEADKIFEVNMGNTRLKYHYTGTQVSTVDIVNQAGLVLYSYAFTYDNLRRLKSQTEFIKTAVPGQTAPFGRKTYNYNTKGNVNVIQLEDYIDGRWQKTGEVGFPAYDKQHNTSMLIENQPFLPITKISVNNPLKEEHRNESGVVMETINYEYIYDTAGNPVLRKTIETFPNGTRRVATSIFKY